MRVAIGIVGLGMVAAVGTGCTQHVPVPADQMARLEAAANKAEAAANKAEAAAKSASDSAARAEAAAAKVGSRFTSGLAK
jgi:hypothetical protein